VAVAAAEQVQLVALEVLWGMPMVATAVLEQHG
jgi:hypothetical protein